MSRLCQSRGHYYNSQIACSVNFCFIESGIMKSKILFGIFCGIALGHCQNVPAAIVVRQEAGTGAEDREIRSLATTWENPCGVGTTAVTIVLTPLSSMNGLVSFATGVVRSFWSNSVPSDIAELMYHSTLFVDGEFYEFTEVGLVQSPKGSRASLALQRKNWTKQWHCSSRKSLHEFRSWKATEPMNKFTVARYSSADNNCHDFVTDACNFLGIPVPDRITNILTKCRDPKYKVWIDRFGTSAATVTASKEATVSFWSWLRTRSASSLSYIRSWTGSQDS